MTLTFSEPLSSLEGNNFIPSLNNRGALLKGSTLVAIKLLSNAGPYLKTVILFLSLYVSTKMLVDIENRRFLDNTTGVLLRNFHALNA